MTAVIRPARDEDGPAVGRLMARCWEDYPGCVYDEGEHGYLPRLASTYEDIGGVIWVAVAGDLLIGSVAIAPAGDVGGAWELTKLYLLPDYRGAGLAQLLMETAEDHAVDCGARRIVLWTDTRFERAHRFYERIGYVADGRTRELHDLSSSVEYFYAKRLDAASVG